MRGMARVLLWQLIARCSSALIISPVSRGAHHHARSLTIMMSSPEDRLTALEESLKALRQEKGMEVDDGDAPVDRLAALENDLLQLRKDMGAPSAETAIDTDVPPVNMPPAPSFPPFPSTNTLGVEGVRCAILFYAFDGIPKAEILLEAFEDEAAEFSACGCALVGVRRSAQDAGDERKAREYEERFPTFNFVGGLESLSDDARAAAGIGADWARSLYYDPVRSLSPLPPMRCTYVCHFTGSGYHHHAVGVCAARRRWRHAHGALASGIECGQCARQRDA